MNKHMTIKSVQYQNLGSYVLTVTMLSEEKTLPKTKQNKKTRDNPNQLISELGNVMEVIQHKPFESTCKMSQLGGVLNHKGKIYAILQK